MHHAQIMRQRAQLLSDLLAVGRVEVRKPLSKREGPRIRVDWETELVA